MSILRLISPFIRSQGGHAFFEAFAGQLLRRVLAMRDGGWDTFAKRNRLAVHELRRKIGSMNPTQEQFSVHHLASKGQSPVGALKNASFVASRHSAALAGAFLLFTLVLDPIASRAESFSPVASPRAIYNFNPDWRFVRADVAGAEKQDFDNSGANWTSVSLPHTWNNVDSYDEFIRHSGGERSLYMGVGWYRKHFKLPAKATGNKVFLEFKGLKQAGWFYVNGKDVGLYENGVTPLGLDVTDEVKFGGEDNVIAVRVDNSNNYKEEATGVGFEWMGKDFNPNYGGLNHDARLIVTGKLYQTPPLYENLKTSGIYIYPSQFDIAGLTCDVTVESQVKNETGDQRAATLSTVIVDADGQVAARFDGDTIDMVADETDVFKATGKLAGAHFWSVDDPYLYDVYTILKVDGKAVDVCRTRTGFRKTEFKGGAGTGGVYINDKFVWLTGYAQRSSDDWAGLGQAYPDWMHDFNAALIRASNGNYVRWMHIAPQAVDVRACNKYGIVIVCPAGDKERDVQGRQWDQRVEVMRDTIIFYRNDPCILFWEAGNTAIIPDHMKQMVALRKELDPNGGRVMGARGNSNNQLNTELTPIAEYYGVMIGQDRRTDQLEGPTAMFRAYSAERRDRAPLIETEDFRDEGARRFWDNYSPPHFGFKPGPQDTYHWNSETFALAQAARYWSYWINRISNLDPTHSRWSGYASIYWSDSNADGRQESSEVARASGKVDSVRLPKQIYYVERVMQSEKPDIHIIGHWTYPTGTKKTIYVVANHVDSVELFLNGKSLGTQKEAASFTDDFNEERPRELGPMGFVYAFADVAFAPGTLKAVGVSGGKTVCETQLETAGEPKAIRLTVHTGPGGLQANGSDVALVDFEVVDAQGRRCPTDEGRVDFTIEGPGIWRGGYNSGIPGSVNNLYLNTECGINRVSIRSTLEPGTITFTARREGLTSATVTIPSLAVEIQNGLSQAMPTEVRITFDQSMAPTAGN